MRHSSRRVSEAAAPAAVSTFRAEVGAARFGDPRFDLDITMSYAIRGDSETWLQPFQ
ncbi:MAG: hypothetical protein H6822_03355 [Planctomycetaceae bacterium]|nr:hypothetical protein [Planctomycetales bacterium]MCB9921191.1 hypothetical protein [Planctomycetaceae bacterium]